MFFFYQNTLLGNFVNTYSVFYITKSIKGGLGEILVYFGVYFCGFPLATQLTEQTVFEHFQINVQNVFFTLLFKSLSRE